MEDVQDLRTLSGKQQRLQALEQRVRNLFSAAEIERMPSARDMIVEGRPGADRISCSRQQPHENMTTAHHVSG